MPRGERTGLSKQTIESQLREALAALPGARVKVGFGASAEKYVLVLAGEDGAALASHASVVERELRGIPCVGLEDAPPPSLAPDAPEGTQPMDPGRAMGSLLAGQLQPWAPKTPEGPNETERAAAEYTKGLEDRERPFFSMGGQRYDFDPAARERLKQLHAQHHPRG